MDDSKGRQAVARPVVVGVGGTLLAAVVLMLLLPAAMVPPEPATVALAAQLKGLYPRDVDPWERWRRRGKVVLPDGRELPREEAWRDDPAFVPAAAYLLSSRDGDDAALGAWLLGTSLPVQRREAEGKLLDALEHRDRGAAFEAARSLASVGSEAGQEALRVAARTASSDEVRAASAWAAAELAGGDVRAQALASYRPHRRVRPLARSFRRGVSWWMSEGRGDDGLASFRRLATLGVDWVSIHTWDPLQTDLDEPELAARGGRHGLRNLDALVRNAHGAGLSVMVKPHLEMRRFRATPEDRLVLRGPDTAERRRLVKQLEERSEALLGGHNRLRMRSDADWRLWFAEYEAYLLPYARDAQAAGADMFCVGRELDSTVVEREADWRRLIARVRETFDGPLVYSANFDSWGGIGFWDTLDFIGVSAYFPLSKSADPSLAELEAGWGPALQPLEEASRRWGRPVLFTEAGFPSIASAASAPWREERVPPEIWLQARCYEATLQALASRPWVEGAFFWLWERSSRPPFRDLSHTIVDKPAMFTMARYYTAQ